MRHLALCVLFVLVSLAAHADSITTFQITNAEILFEPQASIGGFTFSGPGITISGLVNFECPSGWCNDPLVAPGTPIDFGSFVPLFFDTFTIQIGGNTYHNPQAILNAWTMNPFPALFVPSNEATDILLNGNGLIPGSVNTANGTLQFEIKVPAGDFLVDWVPSIESPSYFKMGPGRFFASKLPSPVPEPGSVVLLATGLAGILGRRFSAAFTRGKKAAVNR
jgi:hypothetical protein